MNLRGEITGNSCRCVVLKLEPLTMMSKNITKSVKVAINRTFVCCRRGFRCLVRERSRMAHHHPPLRTTWQEYYETLGRYELFNVSPTLWPHFPAFFLDPFIPSEYVRRLHCVRTHDGRSGHLTVCVLCDCVFVRVCRALFTRRPIRLLASLVSLTSPSPR